jgi:hypothetical protein
VGPFPSLRVRPLGDRPPGLLGYTRVLGRCGTLLAQQPHVGRKDVSMARGPYGIVGLIVAVLLILLLLRLLGII